VLIAFSCHLKSKLPHNVRQLSLERNRFSKVLPLKHFCLPFGELDEVSLAYAVTIHKAQGAEFPAVVIPLATQHYMLLQRNLIYTGITRGKRLVVVIGQKKALGIAVRNDRTQRRYSGLRASLCGGKRAVVP
jgi:exodeoxyribonuclease V alpha subunit